MQKKIFGAVIGVGVLAALTIPIWLRSDFATSVTEENFEKIRAGIASGDLTTVGNLHKLLDGPPDYEGMLRSPSGMSDRQRGAVWFNNSGTRQIRIFYGEAADDDVPFPRRPVESAEWVVLEGAALGLHIKAA